MKKTVIVIGSARSGTSVLAGMLHYMGVNMNPKYNPHPDYPYGSFEDEYMQDFTRILYNKNKDPDYQYTEEDIDTIKEMIKERNESDVWGFKSTLTHYCLDAFMPYLRKPHIVSVSRNCLDHAFSIVNHNRESYGHNLTMLDALVKVDDDQQAIYTALNRFSNVPQFHIQYERIKHSILQSAKSIAGFLDIKLTDEINQKIISVYVQRLDMIDKYNQEIRK